MISVNLRGPFVCIQEFLPNMLRNKWGRIINISSIGGQWGGVNQLHYAASKAALINLTRSISKLYSSKGVICNAISIGLVETDMTKNEIKTNLGLQEKPYRTSGDHILICLQRNGGWSMKNYDVMQFCHDTISRLRQYTDRPIVVRGHPGDKKSPFYVKLNLPNVRVSQPGTTIQQDLANAWATVIYNSSPGVASLIEGVPVFQLDADPDYSMYSEVANFFLENIENPTLHDRQDWLEKISMSHWNFAELKSGEAWDFMRNYV